jgi:hypothetical protein
MLLSLKLSVTACCRVDLQGFHNVVSLTCSALSGLHTEWGHPWGLLSCCPSLILSDTHNGTALQLGASCVRNWNRKPCHVAVIGSVLINSSTATMQCWTDQCSISSKLRRALYTMDVSMEALYIRKDGNYIEKTIRYFWRTLYTHIQDDDNINQSYLFFSYSYWHIVGKKAIKSNPRSENLCNLSSRCDLPLLVVQHCRILSNYINQCEEPPQCHQTSTICQSIIIKMTDHKIRPS